jgi:hypothetical protein
MDVDNGASDESSSLLNLTHAGSFGGSPAVTDLGEAGKLDQCVSTHRQKPVDGLRAFRPRSSCSAGPRGEGWCTRCDGRGGIHYRKTDSAECLRICRVQNFGALGKAIFCRVPHSVNILHSAKVALPSAGHSAKIVTRQCCHSAKIRSAQHGGHLTSDIAECQPLRPRQKNLFF